MHFAGFPMIRCQLGEEFERATNGPLTKLAHDRLIMTGFRNFGGLSSGAVSRRQAVARPSLGAGALLRGGDLRLRRP